MRVEKKPEPAFANATAGKGKKPEKFIPPQPMGKIVILAVLVIAATALFWLAWHNALMTGISLSLGTQNILVIISTLLAFCLMFILMAVTEVVVTKSWIELIITFLAGATVFIFFTPSLWSFVGFLLMVLGFLYWRRQVRIDEKSRIKFVPMRIISAGLRSAVTIILLAACFVYYSSMVTGDDAATKLTGSLVEAGTTSVHRVLDIYYKERYSPSMTLDEFLLSNSAVDGEKVLQKAGVDETGISEIDMVIEQGLSQVQEEALVQAREGFLETFNIEATGDEEMSVIVEMVVKKNIDQYINPYKKFIPALLALSLLLLLNIFRFIYIELIKSFSFILFHILVWLKFIKVKKIQVEAEKITL